MTRTVGVIISDTHIGHKLGVCHPDTVLSDDGVDGAVVQNKVSLNAGQEYLWELLSTKLDEAAKFVGNDRCFILHVGDVVQGNKRSRELLTTRLSDQITAASLLLKHIVSTFPTCGSVRITKGTGAHNFEEGSAEILVSEMLQLMFPDLSIQCVYHGEMSVDGVTIDYAHHGPPVGSRSWLRGNELRFYVRDRVIESRINGLNPAMVYFRGHYHAYRKEIVTVGTDDYTGVILPSMCLTDDYARQATKSASAITNGIVLIEIVDGHSRIIPLINTLDFRIREVI